MNFWHIELIGYAAAIIGTLGWLPQTIKALRSKDTRSLSLTTNLTLLVAVLLWCSYGVMIASWPIIIANGITALLVGALVILKLRHG